MKTMLAAMVLMLTACGSAPCEGEALCACAGRKECRVMAEPCLCSQCNGPAQCICGGGKYLGCADR